jgi:hypothetical protein
MGRQIGYYSFSGLLAWVNGSAEAMMQFYAIRPRTQFKQMQIVGTLLLHFFNGLIRLK